MAGKTISQKNTAQLLLQQKQDLDQLRESLPLDSIRAAEDKLLAQCLEICAGCLDFAALGIDTEGKRTVPFEWNELSLDEKARKIRLAEYGCLPAADVPYGMKAAFNTAAAIIKSRAQEKSGSKVFNMEVSMFPAPAPLTQDDKALDADFEVIDVE